MNRRDLIMLAGGATIAWPVGAWAQQPVMPMIGYLHSASPEPYAPMMAAFRQGLAEAGYVEGQNVAIQYRWAEGRFDQLPALAAELLQRPLAVLVAGGGDVSAKAAQGATKSVPVVFTIGGDPTAYGLVRSLGRPEANVTGVTFFTIMLGPKRLELLREAVPGVRRLAVMGNVGSVNAVAEIGEVQTAASAIGTGVEVPIGGPAGFSGGPFFFWPRYHPAPPTITKDAIVIAMRIYLRPGGRTGGVGIDGFSG